MTTRQQIMFATGRTAAQSGWSESRLVAYMRKRGATSSDIEGARQVYRDVVAAPAAGSNQEAER